MGIFSRGSVVIYYDKNGVRAHRGDYRTYVKVDGDWLEHLTESGYFIGKVNPHTGIVGIDLSDEALSNRYLLVSHASWAVVSSIDKVVSKIKKVMVQTYEFKRYISQGNFFGF